MYKDPILTLSEYQALIAEGYTHIPLIKAVKSTDAPPDIYAKLRVGETMSYLLESGSRDERWGRYSFIGIGCEEYIRVFDTQVIVSKAGEQERITVADPLAWIETYAAKFRVPEPSAALPRFSGGLVGYFGYETIRYIEPKLAHIDRNDTLKTPDIFLLVSHRLAIFDNLTDELLLIAYADAANPDAYSIATEAIANMELRLEAPVPPVSSGQILPSEQDFVSGFGKSAYMRAVEKCLRYITDGEVMQIVLSQRMQAAFDYSPFAFYLALHELNPSPYMYHLDFQDFQVVGSSPETLVRLDRDGRITLRPIAGTTRRGQTEEEDMALEKELLSNEKELAEHLMLIDLGRNDVGRIAVVGSVELTEKIGIERYSHVMHIVSNVCGQKRDDVGMVDVLRACFPAGTLSGAPKVRAMEIIAELEPIKRNIYSGAVGYFGWNGAMDTAIAIRTAVIKDKTMFIQAGGGLVYDSKPEDEWMETMNKARGLLRAVEALRTP